MDWEILNQVGYPGLFIMTFLAATIIPFSSETIFTTMLLLKFNPVYCIIVATAGNWLGGMVSFYIGKVANWNWIEKYLRIKKEKIFKMKNKTDKYGAIIAFFSWLPIIGDVLAVSLGFFRVNIFKVSIFMLIGKALRFTVVAVFVLFLYNQLS